MTIKSHQLRTSWCMAVKSMRVPGEHDVGQEVPPEDKPESRPRILTQRHHRPRQSSLTCDQSPPPTSLSPPPLFARSQKPRFNWDSRALGTGADLAKQINSTRRLPSQWLPQSNHQRGYAPSPNLQPRIPPYRPLYGSQSTHPLLRRARTRRRHHPRRNIRKLPSSSPARACKE
jgi:hypothetical protein